MSEPANAPKEPTPEEHAKYERLEKTLQLHTADLRLAIVVSLAVLVVGVLYYISLVWNSYFGFGGRGPIALVMDIVFTTLGKSISSLISGFVLTYGYLWLSRFAKGEHDKLPAAAVDLFKSLAASVPIDIARWVGIPFVGVAAAPAAILQHMAARREMDAFKNEMATKYGGQ